MRKVLKLSSMNYPSNAIRGIGNSKDTPIMIKKRRGHFRQLFIFDESKDSWKAVSERWTIVDHGAQEFVSVSLN